MNIEANNTSVTLLDEGTVSTSGYSQRISINFGPELDKVIDTLMALRYENDQQLNAVQDLSELIEFVGE